MTDWTDEQKAAFAAAGRTGPEAQRAKVRASIDARYPNLPEEDRAEMAESEYRLAQRAVGRMGGRPRKTAIEA